MKKLTKWVYIIFFLVLIVVMIFYVINRFKTQRPLSSINGENCGDNICQQNENYSNCCIDCECPNNQVCVNNKCEITSTTLISTDTMQTTIESTPSGGGSGGGGGGGGETGQITTTIYIGCSYQNCEACENKTACYDVGCVWCLTNRCLRICKGQAL